MKSIKFISLITLLLCFAINSSLYAGRATQTADYVIVGVGTAGAVLAKKLSDDNKTSVLALHNGSNISRDPISSLTNNAIFTVLSGLIGPPLYISSESIPQVNADDRPIQWVEAVPLGGATSINAGAYCRGTNQVYAQWEAIAGPLWSVNRILRIYKNLESYNGLTTNIRSRGFNGPLPVRQVPLPTQISRKFSIAVINALGVPPVLDYNDPDTPIGVSTQFQYTQMGTNGSLRVSSVNAFLNNEVMSFHGRGVHGRKLRVLFNSPAIDIIWNGNVAIGVRYISRGEIKKVYARRGVIVSAGLSSSSFLLHSGVGPKNLLQSLNIPVIFDNPNVGQNLIDQPRVTMLFAANPADTASSGDCSVCSASNNLSSTDLATSLFFQQTSIGEQLLKSFNVNIGQAANNNSLFEQTSWLPAPGGDPTVRSLRLSTFNPIPGAVLGLLDLLQPKSRGVITIDNAYPFSPPVINFNLFMNPDDLTVLQNAMQIYIPAINTALQAIDPQYHLIYPDPAILNDNAMVISFIKDNIASNMHFQGHCRMAPLNQGGVVDSTGHVYGVQNLIVADNSIAPVGMDGSPMATGYLIGANIANILMGI